MLLNDFLFPGQLWWLTKEGKLKNKNGPWKYSDSSWETPKPGTQFVNFIVEKARNEVMGFIETNITMGSEVILKPFPVDVVVKKSAYWYLIPEHAGWFRIIHSLSKGCLTAVSDSKLTIESKF